MHIMIEYSFERQTQMAVTQYYLHCKILRHLINTLHCIYCSIQRQTLFELPKYNGKELVLNIQILYDMMNNKDYINSVKKMAIST